MSQESPEFESFAAAVASHYSLERELGRGGMGIVYLARDLRLERRVAIKTLPLHLAADATVRERFLREARTAAALAHPNIVPIHRADELGGQVFFVMGFIDGESLADRVRERGPLPADEVLDILREVALALGFAHAHDVIHRDVKAENILLDGSTGRAFVTDFGIARLVQAAPLTATGHVLGSVHYMSPEQVAGEGVDARTDLYALGIVGFLALTGRFPFDSPTASAVLLQHVTSKPPLLRELLPQLPAAVTSLVDRCLEKDPDARFASAGAMVVAIDQARAALDRAPRAAAGVAVSETEAHRLWNRAAALQAGDRDAPAPPAQRPRVVSPSQGYQLRDVKDAAVEAGIGERYVERALAERGLDGRQETPAPRAAGLHRGPAALEHDSPLALAFLGASTRIHVETVVDGEIASRDFDLLLEHIRRVIGETGNVSSVGRSFSWNISTPQRRVSISVVPRNGRTAIYADELLGNLAGQYFGSIVGGVGGGLGGMFMGVVMGMTQNPALAFPAWGLSIAASYVGARKFFQRSVSQRRAILEDLVARLGEQVRESDAESRPLAAPGARPALPR
jgi:tRNA A-37 threonylcarbamoyl transferase component Bud32